MRYIKDKYLYRRSNEPEKANFTGSVGIFRIAAVCIAAFHYPDNLGKIYLKRVMGLPGESGIFPGVENIEVRFSFIYCF